MSEGESTDPNAAVQDAFVTALVTSGVYGKLRAQLRAAAVGILRDDTGLLNVSCPCPHPSTLDPAQQLALELVRDLLHEMQYSCSAGVFEEEASLGGGEVDLAETLNVRRKTGEPVLVTLLRNRLNSPNLEAGTDKNSQQQARPLELTAGLVADSVDTSIDFSDTTANSEVEYDYMEKRNV